MICFNSEASCFWHTKDEQLLIYQCDPFQLSSSQILEKNISLFAMLRSSNLVAFVKAAEPNKAHLYNAKSKTILQHVEFGQPILSIQLSRGYLIVTLQNQVQVFSWREVKLQQHLKTHDNPKALLGFDDAQFILTLGSTQGSLQLQSQEWMAFPQEDIVALTIWNNLVAASNGYLIRVYNYLGQQLYEFRRGSSLREIHSLCFNTDGHYLLCGSDSGTIHIFDLLEVKNNKKSCLSMFSNLSNYCNSQWSFLNVYVPWTKTTSARFISPHEFVVVDDSQFHRFTIQDNRIECSYVASLP